MLEYAGFDERTANEVTHAGLGIMLSGMHLLLWLKTSCQALSARTVCFVLPQTITTITFHLLFLHQPFMVLGIRWSMCALGSCCQQG